MDHRIDTSEDQQATPEHPPVRPNPTADALTAGPHNDPPKSSGIEDTYRAPSNAVAASDSRPWQMALSAAALGLLVVLLARRRWRAR
jgi:hypothetical protein